MTKETPQPSYEFYQASWNFAKSDILRFSEEIDIHPSIILGRLQKEQYLGYEQFRELKENYYFVS
mgnify:CR=1 FL=1